MNCGHTFCEECLQGYLQTYQQQRKSQQGKLPCPTCRELTALPPNGVPGLRHDFKVKKMEEMFRTVNLQERRKSSQMCDACRSQKKQVTAKWLCTNCSKLYCQTCIVKHNNNPVFMSHQVVDKGTGSDSGDVYCKVHQSELAKFFCGNCETVICTLCIINQHEGHNITELTSVYKKHQDDIKNLQVNVESKLARLKAKGTEMEKLRHLNLKSCQQAEGAIKEKTLEMIEAIKAEEEVMLRELRKKRDEKLQKIMLELDSVNFMVAKAHSLTDFASSTVKKNSIRLVAIHGELIQRMKTVVELDSAIPDSHIQSILTFLPSRNDIKLGRIDEIQGNSEELKTHSAIAVSPPHRKPTISVSSSLSRPKLLFNINKMGKDIGQIRDPLGVACLLNGDVVVTEWGNKRIQVFDSVGKPVSLIGMGHLGPQGVAITLKGNIMITDAQNKRLEVFTPSGTSLSKWGLGKFFGPCGIAICPNGNCVVTDIAEHAVNVYQGERKCIRRFGSKGAKSDQFNNPLYVCTGHQSEIIISDSDNHCIKVFDNMGNFLRRIGSEGHNDGQLKFPRGVCMDEDGNIVVADRNNDRVSLFTTQGGFIRHILTREDGIRDPYALAVSSARNLVVTESSCNRAAVKLFQL